MNGNVGDRITLISMDDHDALPSGATGEIEFVDGADQRHVKWDAPHQNRKLALIPGVDRYTVTTKEKSCPQT